MHSHWKDWWQLALTAMICVGIPTDATAQGQDRLGNRNQGFNDVNEIIREGADRYQFGINNPQPLSQVDLSGVDRRTVRNLLRESVLESERLYKALYSDYRRHPELRPLLRDLITMRARASRIAQDMDTNVTLEILMPELQHLNSDWRLLSHQLSQNHRLSNASLDSIQRIDGLGRQLEKLFKMEPQLDRRTLLTKLASLDSSLRNLVEELETDPRGGNQLFQLVVDARKLDQQAFRVQNMVMDQRSYAEIVSEYNRFESMWTAISPRLQTLNNRYIERAVRGIMAADSDIHDLLWLEQQPSRENLRQIADALMRDVDEFFNRVPLKLMMHFRDANEILQTANDFYGTVQNFQDCVARDENEQQMLDCYQYVEEYGDDFVRAFEPLRSQAGRVVLREIEDGIAALRDELNLAGTMTSVDTRAMIPTAAGLENLADHLDYDVRQWLDRERPRYRSEVLQASAAFLSRTQRLHRMLQSHPTTNELKRETGDLAEEFKRIYAYLGRCNTEHRTHLRILSDDISRAIYKLQVPLQL